MRIVRWLVITFLGAGLRVFFKIILRGSDKIPTKGPLIIYTNHTGEIEIPILFITLQPRIMSGLAKVETWDNPLLAWLFDLFGFIPVRRGEADMDAFRKALDWLENGYILGISPEGTRSRSGKLQKAHPGVVTLALKSGAMLLPVAHWGGNDFKNNLRSMKRTNFYIHAGEPFFINYDGVKINKDTRQKIVDEMMFELSALLPSEYQGEYSNPESKPRNYIKRL